MARREYPRDGEQYVPRGPAGGGSSPTQPTLVPQTYFTVSWTFPTLKEDAGHTGFEVSLFTGSTPDDATARLAPPFRVRSTAARDGIFRVPAPASGTSTVNAAVRALYRWGVGSWSGLPGAGASHAAASVFEIASRTMANVPANVVTAAQITEGQTNTGNLWPNPTSEATAPAGAVSTDAEWAGVVTSGSAYAGTKVREVTGGVIAMFVPCVAGEAYELAAQARRTAGTGGVVVSITFYQADKTTVVGSTVNSAAAGASWGRIMARATAPTGAVWCLMSLVAAASTTGQFDACDARRLVVATTQAFTADETLAQMMARMALTNVDGFVVGTGVNLNAIVEDPVTGALVAVAYGTRAYRSQNGGRTWQAVNPAVNATRALATRSGVTPPIIAVGPSNAAARTYDAGTNWTTLTMPAGASNSWNDVVWTGAEWLACGSDGTTGFISRSTDAATWSAKITTNVPVQPMKLVVGNGEVIVTGSNGAGQARISRSTDGGLTWTSVYSGGAGTALADGAYSPTLDLHIAAGGGLVSTDGGATWSTATGSGLTGGYVIVWTGIHFAVLGVGLGGQTTLATSTDGYTWRKATLNVALLPIGACLVNGASGYGAGEEIFKLAFVGNVTLTSGGADPAMFVTHTFNP